MFHSDFAVFDRNFLSQTCAANPTPDFGAKSRLAVCKDQADIANCNAGQRLCAFCKLIIPFTFHYYLQRAIFKRGPPHRFNGTAIAEQDGKEFATAWIQGRNYRDKMKTLLIKGCWNIAKGKLKQKMARWAEDGVEFSEGKQAELLGRIQKRAAAGQEAQEPAVSTSCGCKCQSK
jgi:uncharacterized protein YjbJ (UPF0337 family)